MDYLEAWAIWLETHKGGLAIFATIVSSAAAVISALNARSTKIASDSVRHQNDVRLVALDAKSIAVECEKIKRITKDLHRAYDTLAGLSDTKDSPGQEAFKTAASERATHAQQISEKAVATLKAFHLIEAQSARGLAQMKVEFDLILVELTALTDSMMSELTHTNNLIHIYRDRTFTKAT